MDSRSGTSTPDRRGRSILGDALARAPIRRSSFDRDTGLFDSTPRRFSTGAELMPMPSSLQQSNSQLLDGDWESKGSGSCTPKDQSSRSAAAARFDMCASTPSIARLAALTSPCYFHKRFGDAVNIQKVLDEIQEDDQLSHSRLMQTAAGVRGGFKTVAKETVEESGAQYYDYHKGERQHSGQPHEGVGHLVAHNAEVWKGYKDERFKDMLRFWTPPLCLERPELFDLVITLGGDGTVLFTSWLFQRIVPPVLSFSLGSLGFLTNFQFENYKEQLNKIMGESGMRVNMRMRFTCTVYRSAASTSNNSTLPSTSTSTTSLSTATSSTSVAPPPDPQSTKIEGETHEVLNELVIDRGPSSYISSLDLYANDSLLTRISADGIILSTPTGSTAYSLSAGGSLVHPDIPAILLTPICPHTLSFRPMLLNDDMALKVALPASGRGGAFVSFDGKGRVELGRGDEVVVRASQYPFPTVMGQPLEWFDSISRTLRWNTRAAEQKGWERDGGEDGEESLRMDRHGGEEEEEAEFDIDFEEEEHASVSAKDSGYGGNGSESGIRNGNGIGNAKLPYR
ncbi:hypothetical protein Q7P37_004337 [Cladosporium fusiforme]